MSDLPAEQDQVTQLAERAKFRSSVLQLQEALAQLDQIDCPVTHHFAPGQYARECFLPKGSLVIGKIHKHAHVNIISKGKVSVITEHGRDCMEAPFTFISKVGTKRAVYAHEDTIWTTVHVTAETELDKIEADLIATDYDDLDALTFAEEAKLLLEAS